MIPQPSNLPIRYSASGPVIGNPEGGEAVPGEGFQLRLAEFKDSTGALTLSGVQQDIPTVNAPNFLQATLANPKPNLRYRASALLQLDRTADGPVNVVLHFNWQVDAGAFGLLGSWLSTVGATGVTADTTQVRIESVLALGSALPDPVLDASTSLTCRISASEASGNTDLNVVSQAYIGLYEML